MDDVKDQLIQANAVLLTEDAFEYLKNDIDALDKTLAEIKQHRECYEVGGIITEEAIQAIENMGKAESRRRNADNN